MEHPPENSYTELYKKATEQVNARVAARQQQRTSLQLPDTTPNLGGVGEEAKAPSRSGSFEDPRQASRCRRRAVLTTSQDMGFAPPFRFGYPAGEFSSFAFDPVDPSDMTLPLSATEPHAFTAEPNVSAFTTAEPTMTPFATEPSMTPFATAEPSMSAFATDPSLQTFPTAEEANLQQMDSMLLSGVRVPRPRDA